MKSWISQNYPRPELPDRLSSPGTHFCLIPAKTCCVHAKHSCYRNTYKCSSPGRCSIRPRLHFLKENVFFPAAAALSHPWAASICRPPAPASFECPALQPVPSTLGYEKREHFIATPVFLFTKIKTSLLLGISLPFCLTCSSASICLILIFITLDILKLLDT